MIANYVEALTSYAGPPRVVACWPMGRVTGPVGLG